MKRSVILMGGRTYVLSLPSQWVKKYNIQKGAELDIEEKENSIVIHTENHPTSKEIDLDFSSLDVMLGRALGAVYKSGYSRAKIRFKTKEQLDKIEETLQRTLVGFEIVKQEDNYLIIESLAEIQAQEFENSLKRLFYSIETMGNDLYLASSKQDSPTLQRVIDKDGQINRLADICRRVINNGETQLIKKPVLLYYIVEELERIGDIYKDMAREQLSNKASFSPELYALLKRIQSLFLQYRILFYKFSLEDFERFGKEFYSLRKKFDLLEEKQHSALLFQNKHLLETVIDMNGALLTFHL